MASLLQPTFEELAARIANLQARLIDEHWREIGQLQHRLKLCELEDAPQKLPHTIVNSEAQSGADAAPLVQSPQGSSSPAVEQPLHAASPSTPRMEGAHPSPWAEQPAQAGASCTPLAADERDSSSPKTAGSRSNSKVVQSACFDVAEMRGSLSEPTSPMFRGPHSHSQAVKPSKVVPSGCFEVADAAVRRASELNKIDTSRIDDDEMSKADDQSECGSVYGSVCPPSPLGHGRSEGSPNFLRRTRAKIAATGKVSKMANRKSMELEEKVISNICIDTFKIREMWDLHEKDLLRIKQKALVSRGSISAFPRTLTDMSYFFDRKRNDRFIMHPHSRSRLVWDIMAVSILFYDLITVPMMAFDMPEPIYIKIIVWITVVYWSFDIGASMTTGIYVEGQLEMRFDRIVRRYSRTWLPLDILVTFPEWVALVMEEAVADVSDSFSLFRMLRGSRFIRAVRFFRLLRLLKLTKLLQDLDSRIRDDASILLLQITRLNVFIIVIAHLLACTWYAVGNEEQGWVYVEGIDHKGLGDRYLFSFQWSLARLHPSNMDQNMRLKTFNERILAIVTTLLATVILAVFVSTITTTMVEIKKHRKQLGWKVAVSRKYCREHQISQQLERRVKKFIDSETSRTKFKLLGSQFGTCEAELLKMLPKSLIRDLRHEAWAPVISRMEFFGSIHQQHRTTERDICHHTLREIPVLDGDTIFTTGDACSRMLFLVQGSLSYRLGCVMGCRDGSFVGEDEKVLTGMWMSEAVLWTFWENCGELTAENDEATLLGVCVDDFMKVMRSHELSMIDAALYAKAFLEVLNNTDPHALTDVNPGPAADSRRESFEKNDNHRHSFASFTGVMPTLAW